MADTYLPPKAGFSIEGDRIRTDGSVKRKVTGTTMGGILGCSPWSSPFQVACQLLGLADKDLSSKPAIIAGQTCEEPIIRYAGEAYADKGLFVPAREIYGEKVGSHENWASDFEDEIFAGHVDGIVVDPEGNDHVLEIKTSSNMDMWQNGVPDHYFWQVALYNEFVADSDTAYLVLGIMDPEALKDPRSWVPSADNTTLFTLDMDREAIEAKLDEVRAWYHEFIEESVTPPFDPSNKGDVELYSRLSGIADDDGSVKSLIDEYSELKERIAAHEAEIEGDYKAADVLKSRIKDWMDAHEREALTSANGGYQAKVTVKVSRTLDTRMMEIHGIDLTPYWTDKVTKVFTVKPVKH